MNNTITFNEFNMHKDDSSVKIQNSLATKLLRVVFSFYVIIAVAVTLAHMAAEYYHTKEHIVGDLKLYHKIFEPQLAANIWNIESEQLQLNINSMLSLKVIVGIKVTELPSGEILSTAGILPVGTQSTSSEEKGLFGITMPIVYHAPSFGKDKTVEQRVGEITLYSSKSIVLGRVQLGFAFIIINSIIKTIALWVIFLIVGRIFLTRPLTILTRATTEISLKNLHKVKKVDVKTSGQNELKLLENAFNRMVEDLVFSVQEREQAREELKKNKDLLQSILDNTPAVIYLKDRQGQYLLVNRRYETLFHVENQEVFGKTDADLFPKEVADATRVNDQQVLMCLEPQQFEEEIPQADGLHTYVSVKFPLYQNGLPYAVAGISTDITKRKQAEQKILRLNDELEEKVIQRTAELSQFKATLDVTLDAICMVDVKTLKFTYFNQGFINLTGYDREELYQMQIVQITGLTEVDYQKRLALLLESNSFSQIFEITYQNKDGEQIPVEVFMQYIQTDEQQENKLLVISRDITERKQHELALKEAKEAADIANQAKSTFLANMSHELRTPLNGILGFAQILSLDETQLTIKQREGLEIIQSSGEYLLTLINDVLDLSKIEAGKIELYPADFDFNLFISGLLDLFQIRARQKGILFIYEKLTYLPLGVVGDEKRLRQALINLLGNAVKFTQAGKITFKVGYANGKIRFQIEDTGTGIAPEDLEDIFKPFKQVGDNTYKVEGTGLGLPITKRLIEMMGGELHVKSILGQGTTFWTELSLPESEAFESKKEKQPTILGFEGDVRKILVVDDVKANRSIIVNLLKPLGFEIIEAIHGQDGLIKVKAYQPDLIFMDLMMPILDGFETTQRLRAMPNFERLPIIAASASVFDHHQQASKEVGCDDFIAIPFHTHDLLALLQKQLNLTWIYKQDEAVTANTDDPEAIVYPSLEQMKTLLELAMQGDIAGIIEQIDALKEENAKLAPFLNKIRQLAKSFKEEEICELLEECLKTK